MAVDNIAAVGMVFIGGEIAADLDLTIRYREQHGIGTTRLPLAVFAMTDAAHLQIALNLLAYCAA